MLYCKHTPEPSRALDEMGIREVLSLEAGCRSTVGRQAVKVIATNARIFTAAARAMAAVRDIKLLAREDLAVLQDQYNLTWGEVAVGCAV